MSDLRRLQQRAPRRSTSSDDSGVSAVPSSARRGSSPSGDSDVTHRAVKYDGGPVTRSHFRSLTMEYEYIVCHSAPTIRNTEISSLKTEARFPLAERGCVCLHVRGARPLAAKCHATRK